MNRILMMTLAALLALPLPVVAGEEPSHEKGEHEQEGHDEAEAGHEESRLQFTEAERAEVGIVTVPVEKRRLSDVARVPGEVRSNAYRSAKITPRISAQIVERHARLGDTVEAGAPLVTLSSVDMADAQGDLLVAEQEWQRVQALGREVVSERRFIEAEVAHQNAHARLLAYGMNKSEIARLKKNAEASGATGRFDLVATQAGRVIFDDFVVGDFIAPGRVLFEISDESVLWVEASLTPENAAHVEAGERVDILHDGKRLQGTVVQVHHRLNEATRRQSVRIEVDNSDDLLHPGEFVSVDIPVGSEAEMLAVPTDAVLLIKGKRNVFRLHDGAFEPVEVETGQSRGGWIPITAGLEAGDVIATEGAFHLKSLLLKSQMGSGHGH